MHALVSRRVTIRRSVVASLLAGVMLLSISASASAFTEFSGRLPGKTWTTNGVVEPSLRFIIAADNNGTAICVGPVRHGSGWEFPYGWECRSSEVSWEFSPLSAAAGVDNPNSKEFSYYGWASQT